MHSASTRSRNLAPAFIAVTLGLALGPSTAGLAQDQRKPDAAEAAASADEPGRGRDRRREDAAELPQAQAQAAATPATSAAAEPAVETVEARLVCKTVRRTGTKIGQRVCGTPEQWAARNRRTTEEAQDIVQDIRDQSAFPATPEVPLGLP